MARTRRDKRARTAREADPIPDEQGKRGSATRTWLAGILSAVLVSAIGVVFTAWFTSRGSDTIDRIGGTAPIVAGHVAVESSSPQDVALREPVTDPGERAILLAGASGAERDAVLARHRAALIGHLNVIVVLTGNRSSLRIVDIKPRVLTRGPVSDGALLRATTAGEVGTVEVSADLDARSPRFTLPKDPRTPYFSKKQVDLKRDEQVTFSMTISGKRSFYEFDLVVTVLAEGQAEQIVVKAPDQGPFRLTGRAGRYRSYYDESPLGGWAPVPRDRFCGTYPTAGGC